MNNGRVIDAMRRQHEELLRKYEAALVAVHDWEMWASTSRCIYCGAEFTHSPVNQDEADEAKKSHILVCPKHPLGHIVKERDDALTRLRIEKECGMAVKYSIVDTVGGVDYEGNKTSTINYLQRLRILVGKESELLRLQLDHLDLCGEHEKFRELLREARDNAKASVAEDDITEDRREYRKKLVKRINAVLQPNH